MSRKIITVEDPVEYQLPHHQVQSTGTSTDLRPAAGSILASGANIVMIGEIRDVETADIASTPRDRPLVFNNAAHQTTRQCDHPSGGIMAVNRFWWRRRARVMAQRLLRRVCKHCAQPYSRMKRTPLLGFSDEYLANHQFKKGRGCSNCGRTGYKGRIGIYEIFIVSNDICDLIFRNEPSQVIREAARRNGMHSLREDGMRKAEAGISSLEEVIRVTMLDRD